MRRPFTLSSLFIPLGQTSLTIYLWWECQTICNSFGKRQSCSATNKSQALNSFLSRILLLSWKLGLSLEFSHFPPTKQFFFLLHISFHKKYVWPFSLHWQICKHILVLPFLQFGQRLWFPASLWSAGVSESIGGVHPCGLLLRTLVCPLPRGLAANSSAGHPPLPSSGTARHRCGAWILFLYVQNGQKPHLTGLFLFQYHLDNFAPSCQTGSYLRSRSSCWLVLGNRRSSFASGAVDHNSARTSAFPRS